MNDRIIECRSLDLAKQESTVQWLFEWFVVLSLTHVLIHAHALILIMMMMMMLLDFNDDDDRYQ